MKQQHELFYLGYTIYAGIGSSCQVRVSLHSLDSKKRFDLPPLPFLGIYCSVRISNELGAGHPLVAKFSVLVVCSTSILISIVFSAIVLIFRTELSKLFTTHSEVVQGVSDLTLLLAISVFLNGIQPILSGKKCKDQTGRMWWFYGLWITSSH